MKNLLIAAAGLVIGLLVGSVVPSSKIRGLEAEIEELQRQSRQSRAQDIARFFQQGATIAQGSGDVAEAPDEELTPEQERRRERRERWRERREERWGGEDPWAELPEDAGVEAIREVMELRRVQAREALAEQTEASADQLDAVDQAMSQMNDQLRGLAERMVDDVIEYGEPDRRQMLDFADEGLGIIIAADDAIRGAFDEDQMYAVDDAAVDPFSYVDPAILDVFENIPTQVLEEGE
ncbi:MAG: hypothetical protein EP330_09070 [Deltaproteobacteria bacterium]|nr:MAG: hypothetical protein EP330_09070 [Deltaproteobacteria bacterium]